jgi:Phytanoyl-CoA dioxygenase (PhyH)
VLVSSVSPPVNSRLFSKLQFDGAPAQRAVERGLAKASFGMLYGGSARFPNVRRSYGLAIIAPKQDCRESSVYRLQLTMEQVTGYSKDGTSSATPVSHFGPHLTEDQLATLRRDGFLLVKGLSTQEEIASLRAPFDRMFSERRGWDTGDLFDMVGTDGPEQALALPQLVRTSRYEPLFRQTLLASSARAIAEQILGPKIENDLEHAISKPPFTGAATPWHQDDAFQPKGSGIPESISIWMPLQDVTVENGCMQYIRGSNLGPLYPHRSPRNDPRIHGLEIVSPPDLTNCVAVPVHAGDAVIHLSRTLHCAGVNTSAQPRRAYVLGYSIRARRDAFLTRDHPWNLEKQTAREERSLHSVHPLIRTLKRFRRFARGRKF